MIERDSQLQLVCDSTGARHPTTYDHDDFERMIADAKADGWIITIEKGEWRHYSPESRSAKSEFETLDDID